MDSEAIFPTTWGETWSIEVVLVYVLGTGSAISDNEEKATLESESSRFGLVGLVW